MDRTIDDTLALCLTWRNCDGTFLISQHLALLWLPTDMMHLGSSIRSLRFLCISMSVVDVEIAEGLSM